MRCCCGCFVQAYLFCVEVEEEIFHKISHSLLQIHCKCCEWNSSPPN
jgi:hypothetical protein